MDEAVENFRESGWCNVEMFSKSLNTLSSSIESQSRISIAHYFSFNHAVISLHNGKFKSANDGLKRILNSSNLSSGELVQVLIALCEINLAINQPYKALEFVKRAFTVLSTNDYAFDDLLNHWVNRTLVKLRMLKCRALLMTNNVEGFENFINMDDSFLRWFSLMLRAQKHYVCKEWVEAYASIVEASQALNMVDNHDNDVAFFKTYGLCRHALKNNAFACIFWAQNKPNLAAHYVLKALQRLNTLKNDDKNNLSKLPIFCRSLVSRLQILNNQGLCFLKLDKPAEAFDCFVEVVSCVTSSPYVWLRLAECCIKYQSLSNLDKEKNFLNIVREVVGVGPHRKIVIKTDPMSHHPCDSTVEQGAIPALTIEFSNFCLKNALGLLPSIENDDRRSEQSSTNFSFPLRGSMSWKEVVKLRCSIMCASTYVCLCLGETNTAYEMAKTLLNSEVDYLSQEQKFVTSLYLVEACVLLDKIADAINLLQTDLKALENLPSLTDSSNNGQQGVTCNGHGSAPEMPKSFKNLLYYNAAVAYALNQEFDKAEQTISAVTISGSLPVRVFMFKLYLLLQKGCFNEARNVILQTYIRQNQPL